MKGPGSERLFRLSSLFRCYRCALFREYRVRRTILWCGVGLISACGSSDGNAKRDANDSDDLPKWICRQDSDLASGLTCDCFYRPPLCDDRDPRQDEACVHLNDLSGSLAVSCDYLGCCLLEEDPQNPYNRHCTCVEDAESCSAARPPNARVVDSCPKPEAGTNTTQCSAEGGNCAHDYLHSERLSGCCEGLICAAGAEGVLSCRTPQEGEERLSVLCERAALSFGDSSRASLDGASLKTTLGAIPLQPGRDNLPSITYDDQGQISHVRLGLGVHACSLLIKAGPVRDTQGRLEVTYLALDATDCGEGEAANQWFADEDGTVVGTLELNALTCGGEALNDYCSAGTARLEVSEAHGRLDEKSVQLTEPATLSFTACGK